MSSVEDDRTARARVRDAALELFAEHGEDAVTMRRIADRADVSPALVVHHFGSKAGLREAVVEHVRDWLAGLIIESTDTEVIDEMTSGQWGSIAEMLATSFSGPQASIPAYLRRLMLTGDPVATDLLRTWHERTVEAFEAWDRAGYVDAGPDPRLRAAVLMSADFGAFFLAEQWREVLGIDLLGDGLSPWAEETMRVYAALFTTSPDHPSTEE